MDKVVQNLPFEIVAVPQDVVFTNTSYTMPIKVKIKMKKGDKGIPQQRVISVPKMRSTHPDLSRKVHSDETIMCFDIHMEPEEESKPRRKSQNKFFHLFKTGKCLGTQNEDENDPPYMLTTPVKSGGIKSEYLSSGIQDKKQKLNITTTKTVSKPPDTIFGKCKPGGCLDPPFGEDKYQYYKSVKAIQSKQEVKVKDVEDLQKHGKEILNEYDENIQNSKVDVKDYNESDASSTCMLYKADPRNATLSDKYSESIITYPTRTSSRDLSVLEKKSIMSKQSSSIRNRQVNVDTYFTPTKRSKSQERKSEVLNRKKLEKLKSNSPASIIHKSEYARAVLLQNSEIGEEDMHSNPLELLTQSNDKLSVVEVSGNLLLTVPQIKETINSFKNKHHEIKIIERGSEIEEVINPLPDYKSVSENISSKKENVLGDDELITNEQKRSNLEISRAPETLNALQMVNTSTIKTKTEKLHNKNDIEKDQDNYNEQKNISHIDSKENITTHLINEEYCKEIDNIVDQRGLEVEDKSLDITQYSMKKEIPSDFLYYTNENSSLILRHTDLKENSQLVDLNFPTEAIPNTGNNPEFVLETVKSKEQLSEHITNVLNNVDDHKNKRDNVTPTIKQDQINTSIYSNGSEVYSIEKLALNVYMTPVKINDEISNSVNQTYNTIGVNNDIQTLKERHSVAKVETYVTEKSEPNDESSFNIVSSNISFNAEKKSSDFTITKHSKVSPTNSKKLWNDNFFLQNDTEMSAGKVSGLIDSTKFNQFLEKERSVSRLNMSDNISLKDKISTHSQDRLPTTFYEKDATTATEIDENYYNNNAQNIETSDINKVDNNYLTDNQDLLKEGNKLESVHDLSSVNLVPQRTDYQLLNTTSTTLSLENKIHNIFIDESKQIEVRKSNQGINEILNDANIPTQQTFSENALPKLDLETMNLNKENLSNKSGSIVSVQYLKTENALDIPYDDISKQRLPTDSGKIVVNSIKPALSAVINNATNNYINTHFLANANSTKKDGITEIPQIPYNQDSNEPIETTGKKKKEKEDVEWVPINEIKEKKSESLLKTPRPIVVDLGFQTYLNENGETVLKTFDASQEPQRFSQDKIFIKRSDLKLNELSIALNSDTLLTFKIERKTFFSDERSSKPEEIPSATTHLIYENNKILYDINNVNTLRESLSAIYENDLIPMEQLIRNLRIEIDRIVQYGQFMRKKSVTAIKKTKPTYPKRCVCNRK